MPQSISPQSAPTNSRGSAPQINFPTGPTPTSSRGSATPINFPTGPTPTSSRGGPAGPDTNTVNPVQSPLYFPTDLLTNNSKYGDTGLCIIMYSDNTQVRRFTPTNNEIKDINGETIQQAKSAGDGYVLNIARNRTKDYQIERQIFLPVPLSLNTNYKIKYKDISATEIGASIITDLTNAASSGLSGLLKGASKVSADPRLKALSAAGDAIGSSVRNLFNTAKQAAVLAAGTEGVALNPHQEMLLDGVEFRTFEMSFNMIAKNDKDSESIKEIIQTLKSGMHPGINGNILFTYPSVFELLFYVKSNGMKLNKYLFKTKKCALTDFKIQYGSKDNFITFKQTDAPVDITVTMSFKEIEILTRDEIEGLNQQGYLSY